MALSLSARADSAKVPVLARLSQRLFQKKNESVLNWNHPCQRTVDMMASLLVAVSVPVLVYRYRVERAVATHCQDVYQSCVQEGARHGRAL